jgi:nitrite reductase/ring-hydroxylating ferredoxin subunit
MKTFVLYFTLTLSLVFLFEGCKKNRQERAFYPPINTFINITLPQYTALQVPGGWAYVNAGKQGIIVYARGGNEFIAFDRNCTYNEDNPCGKASVLPDNITAKCGCDGSTYNIFDGSVTNSPAEFPLFQYNTSFNSNSNQLRIYN